MTCSRPFEHWGRGFESFSRHLCLSVFFSVLLLLCVLYAEADPSSKGTYRMCMIRELIERPGVQQRDVETLMDG
jgi:hypothetical protein